MTAMLVISGLILFAAGMLAGAHAEQKFGTLSPKADTKQLASAKMVRGAVSELASSLYENPEEWMRTNEDYITHPVAAIGIHIGGGLHGVKVTGSVSMQELWEEEQEMIWNAAKFWESSKVGAMLAPKISEEERKYFFTKGEKIGRQYKFDENGTPVPINP